MPFPRPLTIPSATSASTDSSEVFEKTELSQTHLLKKIFRYRFTALYTVIFHYQAAEFFPRYADAVIACSHGTALLLNANISACAQDDGVFSAAADGLSIILWSPARSSFVISK